jgi:photosystem II stability/assembly factor-like uncharacterized protein
VLGFAPCSQGQCASLLHTLDGGRHWLRSPAPPVQQTPEGDQVRVQFGNDLDGLVTDGHRLFTSHTAGLSWREVPLPEVTIGAIASNDRFSYAIMSGTAGTRLYSSPLHLSRWAPVPGVALPESGGGGDVVAGGTSAFVALTAIFQSNGYWSTTDGRDWRASAPPCAVEAEPNLGLARDRALFALCSHDPGRGFMAKDLERAQPDGTFGFVSTAPPEGITIGFDAASSATVAVAAVGAGFDFVHRGTAGGSTWDTPFVGDDLPLYDLAFTDARHATMVAGGPGWPGATVYRTTDAGTTWTPLAFG